MQEARAEPDRGRLDVVFQVAGGCGLGALSAAKAERVWGIGVDADQSFLGPHVLTSALKGVDEAVFQTIKAVRDDAFRAAATRSSGSTGTASASARSARRRARRTWRRWSRSTSSSRRASWETSDEAVATFQPGRTGSAKACQIFGRILFPAALRSCSSRPPRRSAPTKPWPRFPIDCAPAGSGIALGQTFTWARFRPNFVYSGSTFASSRA